MIIKTYIILFFPTLVACAIIAEILYFNFGGQ